MDIGIWLATVHEGAKSQTWLSKQVCSPHLSGGGGVMLYILEGRVATHIIWDSPAQNLLILPQVLTYLDQYGVIPM